MTATTGFTVSVPLVRRAVPLVLALSLLATAAPARADLDERARVVVEFSGRTDVGAGDRALEAVDARTADLGASTGDPVIAALSADVDRAAPIVVEVTQAQRADLEADPRVAAVYDDVPIRADAMDTQSRIAAVVPDDPAWPEQGRHAAHPRRRGVGADDRRRRRRDRRDRHRKRRCRGPPHRGLRLRQRRHRPRRRQRPRHGGSYDRCRSR